MGYTRVGDFLAGLNGLALLRSRVTDLGGKPFCDARIADLRRLLDHWDDPALQADQAQLGQRNQPRLADIARYPLRTLLSPGQHVTFSDSRPMVRFEPAHLAFLGRQLGIPELVQFAADQTVDPGTGPFGWAIRSLVWPIDANLLEAFMPSAHDWWPGLQWMIARHDPSDPDGLVLAIKGGHNGEMHNHNDLGVPPPRGAPAATSPNHS